MIKLRSPGGYDVMKASDEAGLDCSVDGAGRTQQSFRDEVDINTIIRRQGLDGAMPAAIRLPEYGDFTGINDFQSALAAVKEAESSFAELPARVRSRFGNDPGAFVAFCLDDRNAEEAKALGLVKEVVEVAPAPPAAPVAPVVKP